MARKLSSEDLERFETLLLRVRRELTGDIDHLEDDAFSSEGHRPAGDNAADVGSDSFSREFSLQLLARDEETLGAVDEALSRIRTGCYGRCEECTVWIPKTRLRAVPHAKMCVSCQRDAERA